MATEVWFGMTAEQAHRWGIPEAERRRYHGMARREGNAATGTPLIRWDRNVQEVSRLSPLRVAEGGREAGISRILRRHRTALLSRR